MNIKSQSQAAVQQFMARTKENRRQWDLRAAGKLVEKYGAENIAVINSARGEINDFKAAQDHYEACQTIPESDTKQAVDVGIKLLTKTSGGISHYIGLAVGWTARRVLGNWLVGKFQHLVGRLAEKTDTGSEHVLYNTEMTVLLNSGKWVKESVEVEDLKSSYHLACASNASAALSAVPVWGVDACMISTLAAASLADGLRVGFEGDLPGAKARLQCSAKYTLIALMGIIPSTGQIMGPKLLDAATRHLRDIQTKARRSARPRVHRTPSISLKTAR